MLLFSKVFYWIVFNKYFKPATYIDRRDFMLIILKIRFKYLEPKYWTYWTVFNKYSLAATHFMDPISYDFLKGSFLIFRRKIKNIIHVRFFKWTVFQSSWNSCHVFEIVWIFPTKLWFSSSTKIVNFYFL